VALGCQPALVGLLAGADAVRSDSAAEMQAFMGGSGNRGRQPAPRNLLGSSLDIWRNSISRTVSRTARSRVMNFIMRQVTAWLEHRCGATG
jgi:hypothetical protein